MSACRTTALGAVCCAAALSLSACASGLTADPNGATSTASTVSGRASSVPGSRVSVGGSLGSFPIPPHVTLIDNVTRNGVIQIGFSGATPSRVSSFYATALPAAGYTITENNAGSENAEIVFTGHGYNGDIGALSNVDTPIDGENFTGNVVGIKLTPG